MKVPGDPRNNYIARMEWADDSDELILQHINRPQNENQVVLASARTGDVRTAYTDRDDAWVETMDDLFWLDGGARFTWVSEKDGWRHVYAVSRADGSETLLTPWDMDVVDVRLMDDEGGWLYFTASPDDNAQRYLYRSRLDGSGEPQRLTPESDAGTNGYTVSPDGRYAFQTHSRMDVPTSWRLVRLPDHEVVRVMADNGALKAKLATLAKGDLEFFRIDREDGPALDGWMMKPPDFDPTKKYPVLFHVYGEPASQTVAPPSAGTTPTRAADSTCPTFRYGIWVSWG